MEAMYWHREEGSLRCLLCPHHCHVKEGMSGICGVRRNEGGKLMADTFGILSAIHSDPIEKKPLYHYHPGKTIISIGSIGCNMKCNCCQNWEISSAKAEGYAVKQRYRPIEIAVMATSNPHNAGVAYTYNEPTVWYEFMLETARLIHFEGKKNVMVSNGYICEEPLGELMDYMDAFNIDLKGFSDEFYCKQAGARLKPVLETLQNIRKRGRHLEITCLVIPSLNDGEGPFRDMVKWISEVLGKDTVLHLSRYHPAYKLNLSATSAACLERLYHLAKDRLRYVYVGNINLKDFQDTRCSVCGEILIRRNGYQVEKGRLSSDGSCMQCNNPVIKY